MTMMAPQVVIPAVAAMAVVAVGMAVSRAEAFARVLQHSCECFGLTGSRAPHRSRARADPAPAPIARRPDPAPIAPAPIPPAPIPPRTAPIPSYVPNTRL